MKDDDDDEYIQRILAAASVEISNGTSAAATLQAWLGLTVDDTNNIELESTVEDAELSDSVYGLVAEWLMHVYKPEQQQQQQDATTAVTAAVTVSMSRNQLLESQSSPDDITLDAVWDSVRVTRWLRYWMDLHVSGSRVEPNGSSNNNNDNTASVSTLSQRLLQQDSWERLVNALFYHIQYLPVLQSQMDRYTNTLRQQQSSLSSANGLSPELATSRIQHYQRAQETAARLQIEWQEHLQRLQVITGEWYASSVATTNNNNNNGATTAATSQRRVYMRKCMGQTWSQFVRGQGVVSVGGLRQENTQAAGIHLTLKVLHRILLGVSQTGPAHRHLLFHQLLPLHRIQGMVLWRDQTAVLELYHEPLTVCVAVLLQKQLAWVPAVVTALLHKDIFPVSGNTPKQVLLLHEIDTFLGLLVGANDKEWQQAVKDITWLRSLYQVTGRCMASDHSRVAERALSLFKNAQFERLVQHQLDLALSILLPVLVKNEPSWNPTVRKMTYHVLVKLKGYDDKVFASASQRVFATPLVSDSAMSPQAPRVASASASSITAQSKGGVTPIGLSLKAGMGTWRPPTKTRTGPGSMPPPFARPRPFSSAAPPPATVTGVAPWAMNATPSTVPPVSAPVSAASLPPLTVTGVAPWAMKLPPSVPTAASHKRRAPDSASKITTEETDPPESGNSDTDPPLLGLERVLAYMKQIQPPEEEHGVSSWSQSQMEETPTLLPNLKFHDLVFGHDLGTGAFGSVRYARLIEKSKTRSHWPEYAVKVVSTEKIRELGYETSIQREIAVLRMLSHPGIARLVSSFRFQEGAYLVLEYASGGDLHTLLRKHGSLDHESTRFVMGEVVGALASVHDLGLVYADLKPENIVITETGHVKLTDFGGSRPVTQAAKDRIKSIAKDILKTLRDGGWKQGASLKSDDTDDPMDEDTVASEQEDMRIEGTTAYLPPEVVMGAYPTTTADSWALGCVLYQCLSGRPPLLEGDDTATRNRIVSFDAHESSNEVDRLFQDKHAIGILPEAKDLIKSLLEREPSKRPGMHQTAQHDFFTNASVDVFNLHLKPAYPLDVGDVSPSPDAQWSRRQFSSIWAPQPVAYNISLPTEDETFSPPYDASLTAPIAEGEETTGFFSTTAGQLPGKLGLISERESR